MNLEKLKTKFVYFIALGLMCTILVAVTYNFFLKTIQVNVMKNIVLTYSGESGNASVSAAIDASDLNKRTQSFLETVTYTVEPSENLSNGDTIHVVATYSESVASQYHFEAKNAEADFEVEGLPYRYETLEDIDSEYLDEIDKEAQNYANDNANDIYEIENQENDVDFQEAEVVYKAFLKSKSSDTSDRVIEVFALRYYRDVEEEQNEEIQEETTDEKEQEVNDEQSSIPEGKEEIIIYYTVTVPDINDSNAINTSDIFGEKAYMTEDEIRTLAYPSYLKRIYGSQYDIYEIVKPEEEIIDDQKEDSEQ